MKVGALLFQVTMIGTFLAGVPASAFPLSGHWLTENRALIVSFPGHLTNLNSQPRWTGSVSNRFCEISVRGVKWRDGKVFDPVSEEIYAAELSRDGDMLSVRVSTGFLSLNEAVT